jgi:xylan 1,4-beta-xylosidase
MNREGIRKPAYFAYKYLHELQGKTLPTADGQAMVAYEDAGKEAKVSAVLWDFEQPEQKVSNHPFYTHLVMNHSAAPIKLRVAHLKPGYDYSYRLFRTGFHANDAYSAYLEMGSPKALSAEQLETLQGLTRDVPEKSDVVQAAEDGSVGIEVPMRSNDIVLVKMEEVSRKKKTMKR